MPTDYRYVEELNHHVGSNAEKTESSSKNDEETGESPEQRVAPVVPRLSSKDSGCSRGVANRKANGVRAVQAPDGGRAPSLYMVQSGGPSGPVKIGYATNVLYRVSNLQTGNPERLTLILEARVPDPAALEAELHDRFCAHRIRGEWFRYHQDVAAACAELQRFSPAMLMAELLQGAL